MAYTVLARRYRPGTFDEVVGQKGVSQTLRNAIKAGKVAHAYIFSGTRGVGKTTTARILAKSLNCLKFDEPTAEPCCECESCVAISTGDDIDVIEIDGATNNGIEQVRQLRQNAIYAPARARYKIYIIDEVHMLSTQAFNALLKILEEPPSHVKFIFATTEPNKIIATIQSRCQRFDFKTISAADIAGHLKNLLRQEKIDFEDDVVVMLAKKANGSIRDGLSVLDQLISTGSKKLTVSLLEEFLGSADSAAMTEFVGRIAAGDAAVALECLNELNVSGLSEVQIVSSLTDYLRDLMIVKAAGVDSEILTLTSSQKESVKELAEKFDIQGLIYGITALEKLRWTVRSSDTPRAILEATVLRLAMSEKFLDVSGFMSGGDSAKKKTLGGFKSQPVRPPEKFQQSVTVKSAFPTMSDIDAVKSNWTAILKSLPNSLSAVLSHAQPVDYNGSTLTLCFDNDVHKQLCESNGRVVQIETALSECFGTKIKVGFVVDSSIGGKSREKKGKNEIISDPAVKMLIKELGGKIAGIEED